MTTFITNNSCYIHIPKTGGRFVTEVCNKVGIIKQLINASEQNWGKHADPKDVRKYIEKRQLFTFTTVRHPITWYQSLWASHMTRYRHKPWKERDLCKDLEAQSFNEFLKNCLKKRPGWYTEIIKRFTKNVNFICYYECLRFDIVKALKTAGETCDFSLFNGVYKIGKYTSNYKNFDIAYNRNTLKGILTEEKYVIDKYYSFN